MQQKAAQFLFNTSYHPVSLIILYGVIAFMMILPVISYLMGDEEDLWIPFIICWGCAALLWWIGAKTYYIVNDTQIKYVCGPIRGKIEINSIRKIEKHDGWYIPTSYKISMDKKGVILYYNRFDDIFLSPKDVEGFISKILDKNPQILIISKNN